MLHEEGKVECVCNQESSPSYSLQTVTLLPDFLLAVRRHRILLLKYLPNVAHGSKAVNVFSTCSE